MCYYSLEYNYYDIKPTICCSRNDTKDFELSTDSNRSKQKKLGFELYGIKKSLPKKTLSFLFNGRDLNGHHFLLHQIDSLSYRVYIDNKMEGC